MPRPQRELDPNSLVGYFGAELRTRRNQANLSMAQLAAALGYTPQWIGQVELAEKPPSEQFGNDLDTYFETGGSFHRLWKAIKRAGRSQVLLPGFPAYIELEAQAVLIRSFVAQLVPGLLQTEDYARAVINAWPDPAPVGERVATRMEQQGIFRVERPPYAWFVLDEAVLHRPFGGQEVMREQLKLLAGLVVSPNVQVRILPFASTTYAGLDGKFTLLRLGDGTEILYQEGPGFSQLIEDPSTVADCAARFDLVMGEALPRSASQQMLLERLEDLT
ncbi:helix-turn-helix domain-containing protein [Actinomadura sp. HBU206391]|uniref:helix-turn-helix domain-containing protein n=1 Tax=Actinomadura sp. HBU206391 TaxID=2731692 RepID=UPI001650BF00|nr:helix-turn-helix transcriptional regulator [Actinomadura sp. HBU206391]MBC6457120.1 helix-turn-helix domain-containing protein [Actinomadura sp. HBU206391]